MKILIKATILICFLLVSSNGFAKDKKPVTKVGSNVLSLLAVGDINFALERSIMEKLSATMSMHYFRTEALTGNEGSANRIAFGLRAYKNSRNLSGNFIESKLALIEFEEATEEAGPLSFEFYFGNSKSYNEFIFYEWKVGMLRLISPGEVVPSGGFTLGAKF